VSWIDDIRAKQTEAQKLLQALQTGPLHIGAPFEGRTEAKITDLRRQIAEYQSIIDKDASNAGGTSDE
jgi:hypothetical protein